MEEKINSNKSISDDEETFLSGDDSEEEDTLYEPSMEEHDSSQYTPPLTRSKAKK